MGPRVSTCGILTMSVCPAGFRVGAMRVSALFCRDFLRRWPKAGLFQEEKRSDVFRRLLAEWAIATCLAALFFTLVEFAPQSW